MRRLLNDRMVLDFVEHVYAAGCDPRQWTAFVDTVHASLPGVAFSAHLGIEGTRIDVNSAATGIPKEYVDSYLAHYQFLNPYNALFQSLKQGRSYTITELIKPGWLDRHVFYHEWLKPAGNFTHGASVVVARDDRRLMRVSFDIPNRYAHLEPLCAKLLERLGPHIARAFEVNERLQASIVTESALAAILGRIEGAAALVGKTGRVVALNGDAERMARSGVVFRISRDRRLAFRHAAHADAYVRALASVFQAQFNESNIFAVKEAGQKAQTVVVLPLRLAAASAALCVAEPLALLVVHGARFMQMPGDLLRALHGLTNAEAKLVSVICAGSSVNEAAELLKITRPTARNQLAAAMAKMGVHRQGELVGAVAALAPRLKLSGE